MNTLRAPEGGPPGAVAALGNLDGVHLGHQRLIEAARRLATRLEAPVAAAVFEPHPRRFFQPEAPPFRLQTPAQRARALREAGVEAVFTIPFDEALARSSDVDFARTVLQERLALRGVVVGADFRFGRGRMGDAASLKRLGEACGFEALAIPEVNDDGGAISSTRVRAALAEGRPEEAARLLGRPWAIEGVVCAGMRKARELGHPTANVDLADYVRPRFGVYAVRVCGPGFARRAGVANIGVKPTVGAAAAPLVEPHLFDFSGDLYGATIEVALEGFIRPERRFESLDALKAQIERDAAEARARLG